MELLLNVKLPSHLHILPIPAHCQVFFFLHSLFGSSSPLVSFSDVVSVKSMVSFKVFFITSHSICHIRLISPSNNLLWLPSILTQIVRKTENQKVIKFLPEEREHRTVSSLTQHRTKRQLPSKRERRKLKIRQMLTCQLWFRDNLEWLGS